jgi:hypothetical protein
MSDVLVYVAKKPEIQIDFPELRGGARALRVSGRDEEDILHSYRYNGDLFVVNDPARSLDVAVKILAAENPGKEIRVYTLTQISTCPAGEMVTKKVSKEGVLPL